MSSILGSQTHVFPEEYTSPLLGFPQERTATSPSKRKLSSSTRSSRSTRSTRSSRSSRSNASSEHTSSGFTGESSSEQSLKISLLQDDETLSRPATAAAQKSVNDDVISYKNLTAAEWLKFVGVAIAAGAGAAASISTFLVAPAVIVFVAGGVNLCNVPAVWLKEWKLSIVPAARRKINSLRKETDRLRKEVDSMLNELNDLEMEADRMRQEAVAFDDVVKKAGASVDEIVSLVNQNQRIVLKMKASLRQVIVQDIVKQVIQSDLDKDGILSEKEARILEYKIQVTLKAYGIVIDVDKFHRAIGLSPSISNVIKIVRRLLPQENDDRKGNKGWSHRRQLSQTKNGDDDNDDSDDEEDDDEIYDMYYMPAEAAKGVGCAWTIRFCKEYQKRTGQAPMYVSMSTKLRRSSGIRSAGFTGCSMLQEDFAMDDDLIDSNDDDEESEE